MESPTPPRPQRDLDTPEVVRLSAGLPTGNLAVVIVLSAFAALVMLPLLTIVAMALAGMGGTLGVVGPAVLGTGGFGLFLVLVWAVCRAVRGGAYVQGTELTVRGAVSTRRVDLATARSLRVTDLPRGWGRGLLVPIFDAREDAWGRSARVVFRRARDGYLPRAEVEALVSAIRAGGRQEAMTARAEHAVTELTVRADPPLG